MVIKPHLKNRFRFKRIPSQSSNSWVWSGVDVPLPSDELAVGHPKRMVLLFIRLNEERGAEDVY